MKQMFDVAIIGGGIVGLAHAWMAARRGLSVVLLERTSVAQGASVRNFGMVWPIGQPAGELHAIAMRSRQSWQELGREGIVEFQECGSIHLAHRDDERAVLEEFCDLEVQPVTMLTPEEVLACAPLANPHGLLCGMFSDSELRVNPRIASARIALWLAEKYGVVFHFNTLISTIDGNVLYAAGGREYQAARIIVCGGSDIQLLFPHWIEESGLKLCKLHMMKAIAQPEGSRQAVHLASGLTLRHYGSFQGCSSLLALKSRIAEETPELNHYGIHVMASQLPNGEVILGDSHEYGDDITPFDKTEIDELMLREIRKVFRLANETIVERWHGIYAKHSDHPVVENDCGNGVHIINGTGGAGMTMSFGLAERTWKQWLGEA